MTIQSELKTSRDEEPIAALASGSATTAAVSMIRLTGAGSWTLLSHCLKKKGISTQFKARELCLCTFHDPRNPQEVLDEVMAVMFAAPRSFTGQESAEIHCHGSPYVVQRILGALYHNGFRPAEPGEFTRRAFLNGKMDLTAAEGVKELIEAQSHQQWLAARQLASGKLAGLIQDLRRELIGAMAYLEAQIDFPDEGDTASLNLDEVRRRVATVKGRLSALKSSYDNGRVASRGLAVALFGQPNAGKSTLMNTLLGRDRAIVTPIAGTTRDYIEETCLVNGRLIRLIDMAGIRESQDEVERIGIEAALKLAKEADIVLFLMPADATFADSEAAKAYVSHWVKELEPKAHLTLVTKADLGGPAWGHDFLALSCKAGTGLEEFRGHLSQHVDQHVAHLEDSVFLTSARHLAAVNAAEAALLLFDEQDAQGAYEECLAFELQAAARALASIVGAIDTDNLLDRIFSDFCIGK